MQEQAELKVPEAFVNDFFLEILSTKKHLKTHKEITEKENKERLHEIKDDLISLEEEAEQIQGLEEKAVSEQVATPVLAPKTEKTIQTIALPPAPSFSKIHVPIPPGKKIDFLDLGNLNQLVSDPEITLIQCDGANSPVKVNKKNQSINTNIHLDEQEIREIIKKFSFRAGVQVTEPVFKTEINHLAITAVIPEFSSPKFIIVRK